MKETCMISRDVCYALRMKLGFPSNQHFTSPRSHECPGRTPEHACWMIIAELLSHMLPNWVAPLLLVVQGVWVSQFVAGVEGAWGLGGPVPGAYAPAWF